MAILSWAQLNFSLFISVVGTEPIRKTSLLVLFLFSTNFPVLCFGFILVLELVFAHPYLVVWSLDTVKQLLNQWEV